MNDIVTRVFFVERLCKLILITNIPVKIGRFESKVTFEANVGNIDEAKKVIEEMGIDLKIKVE